MNEIEQDRIRGCAVGAVCGDALGMPLEFAPPNPLDALVREMISGRLPAGSFTDDTEMALAVAESLLATHDLDPSDLARRFLIWYKTNPPDVGLFTSMVLQGVLQGLGWQEAARRAQEHSPHSASNGSLMRCWPVAIARWRDWQRLLAESALQSRVTHPHPDCVAACVFVNAMIYEMIHGVHKTDALGICLELDLPEELRTVIRMAPSRNRGALRNTGWVHHTMEAVVWGLVNTDTFEDALVEVVNLGSDADTAGTVVGALAGAYYGLGAIPDRWVKTICGLWLPRTGIKIGAGEIITMADRLSGL